ncbi:Hint domain-containing protein [Methylobacterium oryzisoli]|uniref:Hint domain-containing protein n=1 Tax=Methylobacterium oryzisoli TaxID=3385502 RepID=UPI00389185D5
MALPIVFNNTVYAAGFAASDDGAPSATFGLDDISTANISLTGTINAIGDPVQATGILPGASASSTTTLYATQYDSSGLIQFSDSTTNPQTRFVFSNSQLAPRQRVTFDSNNTPGDYTPVCFVTGTPIRVVRDGAEVDVVVEDLRVGDQAVTASGHRRPIVWIGHRTLACRRHPRPGSVMPVRIAAGAFGEGRPARDVFVSPGHAICVDVLGAVLIPVSHLVNGATIAQVEVDTVTYWHVELDRHDVLLAGGLPAESYIDCGNRSFFATGQGEVDPARTGSLADYCHPLAEEAVVTAVHGRLRSRALQLGWTLDTAPLAGLHLVADGRVVRPTTTGTVAHFALPADARDVWLVSDTSIPAEMGVNGDTRRLGVSVQALGIEDGSAGQREIPLDDPRLATGFHRLEHEGGVHRWTDGRAHLPASLWEDRGGPVVVHVACLASELARWVAPAAAGVPEQAGTAPHLHAARSAA